MFDPSLPAANTPLSSAQMRSQLTGLKTLIDAVVSITAAQVDGVSTLPAGEPATVSVSVTSNTLHLTFGIPQGEQGPQGEVSYTELTNAIDGTSSNSNGVSTLNIPISDPPQQWEVQQIADKLDELINALRR